MSGRWTLLVAGLLLLLGVGWWVLSPEPGEVRQVRLLLGTTVEIVAVHPDGAQLNQAVAAAFDEIARIERLMDPARPNSDVARLSVAAKALVVSPETAEVIALGQALAERSSGAFDMSLGRLKALWGLDGEQPHLPAVAEITVALRGSGPGSLVMDGRTARKAAPALQHDLGGVAKGYAVDRAIALLRQHGVTSAAVNAGGDMYLLGQRQGRPWRIGIQHPRQPGTVLCAVDVSNRAVVTSGDYERFFEQNGQRYHHLFDPATGYPSGRCQSVTVIADTVAVADALATALFVLGPEKGLALLSAYPGAEALLVTADGALHRSVGWQEVVTKNGGSRKSS